jgi:hypothetical protein
MEGIWWQREWNYFGSVSSFFFEFLQEVPRKTIEL